MLESDLEEQLRNRTLQAVHIVTNIGPCAEGDGKRAGKETAHFGDHYRLLATGCSAHPLCRILSHRGLHVLGFRTRITAVRSN